MNQTSQTSLSTPECVSTLARERISALPQLPQAQYSLSEQLSELRAAAVKMGLYDAADFLKTQHAR